MIIIINIVVRPDPPNSGTSDTSLNTGAIIGGARGCGVYTQSGGYGGCDCFYCSCFEEETKQGISTSSKHCEHVVAR